MINRDDQIARLNKDIADLQEQLSRKDSSLKNLDHELRNAQEDRRNVEDSVRLDMNQVLKTQKIWNESFVFLLYKALCFMLFCVSLSLKLFTWISAFASRDKHSAVWCRSSSGQTAVQRGSGGKWSPRGTYPGLRHQCSKWTGCAQLRGKEGLGSLFL